MREEELVNRRNQKVIQPLIAILSMSTCSSVPTKVKRKKTFKEVLCFLENRIAFGIVVSPSITSRVKMIGQAKPPKKVSSRPPPFTPPG